MGQTKPDWQEIKPLGEISCSSSACDRDLHCFMKRAPKDQSYRNSRCVSCKIDLIDWKRLDKHDLNDTAYTIEALERELVRHIYWHKPIDEKAIDKALKKGIEVLRAEAETRIRKSVGLPRDQIFRDGTQTPTSGNVLYYAQHATATCCRKCIEVWHGIDRNRALSENEISYMRDLVMLFVEKRVPSLTK
jgi:hypothetical protein